MWIPILINLSLAGEFEKESVRNIFKKDQKNALDWLEKNVVTFDEFLKKFKT